MENYIEFNCIPVKQPIGTFYIGCVNWSDIVDISFADIRTIEKEEKREVETYLGIQRRLDPSRAREIAEYVSLIDATFPSSVILAVESEDQDGHRNVVYDSTQFKMRIRRDANVAKIIDGQHRLEGLKIKKPTSTFELNVTVFVDMDIEDQAIVFATINKTQTKVNKSLVYDLYDFAHSRSPQKTCHNIVKLLNAKEGSPFKDRIKILGQADDKERETITQATFVENIQQYISRDPMKDRDNLKRGRKLDKATGKDVDRLFLRNMFIDEKDAEIAKLIWNYFHVVQEKWPTAWNEIVRGNILNRTTGFIALMRFFKNAYLHLRPPEEAVVTPESFRSVFAKVSLKDSDFTPQNYEPGSSGQSKLFKELVSQSGL